MITRKHWVWSFSLFLFACVVKVSRTSPPESSDSPSPCGLESLNFIDSGYIAAGQSSSCNTNAVDTNAVDTTTNANEDQDDSDSDTSTAPLSTPSSSPISSSPTSSPLQTLSPDQDRLRRTIVYLSSSSLEIVVNLRQTFLNRFNRAPPTIPCFYRKRSQESYLHPDPRTNFEARLYEDYTIAENYLRYYQHLEPQHIYNTIRFNPALFQDLKEQTRQLRDRLRELLQLLNVEVSTQEAWHPRQRCYESWRLVSALMNMEDYLQYYIPSDLHGLFGS